MKRREFLQTTLVGAGSVMLVGCPEDGISAEQTYAPPETHFPQSVASGDPRPNSVIVWTRVWDADAPDAEHTVSLEVATDIDFTQKVALDGATELELTASPGSDHCVKVRVTGLTASTSYHYRFTYDGGPQACRSRIGRTRTAPAPDEDVPVTFAYVTCQDQKEGQRYNPYQRLLEQHPDDLAFIVHLGDYIYEKTTPNRDTEVARPVRFTDTAGAILLYEGDEAETYAASSLANYRELYRHYRSDPWLQRVHESYPFIQLWDDHEFANDCWGYTATDTAGRQDEADEDRRKRANQAWSEYQPVDFSTPDFVYDPTVAHPADITIYRDFEFGRHLHLVVTDLRSYRADHPVAEDALPGTVAVDQAELIELLGLIPSDARPYVDIDAYDNGSLVTPLQGAAGTVGFDAARITGLMSVDWINAIIEQLNAANAGLTPIDDTDPSLEFGYAFVDINKTSAYSSLGSRNLLARGPYEAYCAKRFAETNGDSEIVMGATQWQWFLDTLNTSTKSFKVWANEYCLNHLAVDLSALDTLPDAFRKAFYVICDDWTAFPNKKAEVLAAAAAAGDVVAITGDVHAFFAATPFVAGDTEQRIVEFVTSSISSATIQEEFIRVASSDPNLAAAGAPALALAIGALVQDPVTKPSPQLAFHDVTSQGFATMTVDGAQIRTTFHRISEDHNYTDLSDDGDFDAKWATADFRVDKGAPDLYHDKDGTWQKWDADQATWVDG